MNSAENAAEKQRGRPFAKGRSGNPAGKAKGCLNKATRAVLDLLDGEAEALTRKAVELALAGDVTALRFCLERLAPPRKDRPVSFDVPALTGATDVVQLTASILRAVGQGELTPSEGAALAGMAESFRKQVETADLEQRIAALEERQEERT